MIHDLLVEYAKVVDWYIEKYPNETVTLDVKKEFDKDFPGWKFYIQLIITYENNTCSLSNYVTEKMIKDSFYYSDIKAHVLDKTRRIIEEKIDNRSN
jgi:hypothetical protein